MTKKFRQVGDELIEFTQEEYALAKIEEEQYFAFLTAQEQADADKAAKKLAAEAKLAALGLDTDDLKALGLG